MRTRPLGPISLLVALVAIVVGGVPAAAAPAFQTLCTPSIALGDNLVANGDAEAESGAADETTVVAPLCWTTTSTFSAIRYGTNGFPATVSSRGANFFGGGPGAAL